MSIEENVQDPDAPLVQPVNSAEEEERSRSTKSNKLLAIGCSVLVLGVSVLGYYVISMPLPEKPPESAGTKPTYVQQLKENVQNMIPVIEKRASPSPSVIPQVVMDKKTVDDIVKANGYEKKVIEYVNNDGPTVSKENIQIKIPGQQSVHLVSHALAGELESLYPIYLQNPTKERLDGIAKELGIQASAKQPESQVKYRLEYVDPEARMSYDPAGGKLSFEAKPGTGDLPTVSQAENQVKNLLTKLGFELEGREIKVSITSLASMYENAQVLHPAIVTNVMRQHGEYPIVYDDVDFSRDDSNSTSLSPEISVHITGSGKITRMTAFVFAENMGTMPVNMTARTLESAIAELREFGGHVRNIIELEGQRSNFACHYNRCDVHDAVITKAYKGYYWNNTLSSVLYDEMNDTTPRALDYLLPVWIFEGTGLMDKAKVDTDGKLMPNPDKSNNDEFYSQKVKFKSTVLGVNRTDDVNILETRTFNLEKIENNKAKVTFETRYLFPTFTEGKYMMAGPRNGIKYRLLVLFPDKTYSVVNGYKREVYPGEVIFDLGTAKGEVTTYLELSDFTNLVEKRSIIVD